MSTRQNLGFRLIEQRRRRISTANVAPNQPTISHGTPTSTGVTLTGSAFSDSDVGDTHAASQWQVTAAADTGYASPVYSTGDSADLTFTIATGLSASTAYIARVRYKDSAGNYSAYSSNASFTTAASGATVYFYDSYTGDVGQAAFSDGLHPHETGSYGSSGPGAFHCTGTTAKAADTGGHYATFDPGVTDAYTSVRVLHDGGSVGTGVMIRSYGPGDCIWAFIHGSTITLERAASGGATRVALGTATVTWLAGDKIGILESGNNISVYHNDVEVIAPVISTFQSERNVVGFVEIGTSDGLTEIDDLRCVSVVGG